jgi:Outer membrane protein
MQLEDVWKIAEVNNRQLKLSTLQVQQGKFEVLEARDRLLPELILGGDIKINSKFLIYNNGPFSRPQDVPVKGYGYSAGYSLNYKLFNGGMEKRNIRMKQEEEAQRQYEANIQKHSIKYNAAFVYFNLCKFLHFADFLNAEIAMEERQLTLIESLQRNGVVLKSDVLRVSVKLSKLELALSDIRKKIEINKQRLNLLMGREPIEPLEIDYKNVHELETIQHGEYSDYMDIALNQSPEFKLTKSEIKWSELNIRQIKATRLPKVSMYSVYNYSYPQISFYPYSNDLWGFGQTGINVQFSIDNLYKSKHSVARARIVINQAQEKASLKREEISLQIKEAYLQRAQALESVQTITKNITKSNETLRVIRNSYLHQESLLTDLLEAENALLEAKFNLTTAQTDVKLGHLQLLAVVGIL